MTKWDLGQTYDVTDYFNKQAENGNIIGVINRNGACIYENGYFFCRDVRNVHVYRIQVGINSMYEEEPRTKIIEMKSLSYKDLAELCVEKYDVSEELLTYDERVIINQLIDKIGIEEVLKTLVGLDYESGFENDTVKEFRYDEPLKTLKDVIWGGSDFGMKKIRLD